MKIQAALLHQPNTPLQIETLDLDSPGKGEVLVRIAASGVCHSDYHVMNGATKHPLPAVLGHEGAGVVEAVGTEVSQVHVSDHVVLNWAPACGHCFYCLRDKPNLCETFTEPIWAGVMLDGTPRLHLGNEPVYHYCGLATFAEYVVVPQESCVPIRRDVPLKVAALVGLAPMGTATNLPGAIITRQEKVVKGSYYGTVNANRDFPKLLDLYVAGKLKLDELISQEYPLSDINVAFDAMLSGGVARGVVMF